MLAEGFRRSRLQGESLFDACLDSLSKAPGCFSIYPALAGLHDARCRYPNMRQEKQKGRRLAALVYVWPCITRHGTGE